MCSVLFCTGIYCICSFFVFVLILIFLYVMYSDDDNKYLLWLVTDRILPVVHHLLEVLMQLPLLKFSYTVKISCRGDDVINSTSISHLSCISCW